MGGSNEKYSDDSSKWLLKFDHTLHSLLPVVLVLLIGYLVVVFFTDFYHPALSWLERFVLGYFVLELAVAFVLYDSKRKFFTDKWFHILLILPIFAVFRAAGRVAILARSVTALEGVQGIARGVPALQAVELAGLQRAVGSSRLGRVIGQIGNIQKSMHAVVDIPKVLRKKKQFKLLIGKVGIAGIFASSNDDSNSAGEDADSDDEIEVSEDAKESE